MITVALLISLPTVVLAGVVRRSARMESNVYTIRLQVNRVLSGDTRGISLNSVKVYIFAETNIDLLWRGQNIILTGIVSRETVYVLDTPIKEYTSNLEKTVLEC